MAITSPSGPTGPADDGPGGTGSTIAGEAVSVSTTTPAGTPVPSPALPTASVTAPLPAEGAEWKEPERTGTGIIWVVGMAFRRATDGREENEYSLKILRTVARTVVMVVLSMCVTAVVLVSMLTSHGGLALVSSVVGGTGLFGSGAILWGGKKVRERLRSRSQDQITATTPPPTSVSSAVGDESSRNASTQERILAPGQLPAVEIPPPRSPGDSAVPAAPGDPAS